MTIFYFTSTGNCLAVAKRIGGNLISIPQVVDGDKLHFEDDVIGVVYPIYGFGMPKIVKKFMEKVTWKANYVFIIGTFGNMEAAAMMDVQNLMRRRGQQVDYAKALLMVDNYLPGFDMNEQVHQLPEKRVEAHLSEIVQDIQSRVKRNATASTGQKILTFAIQKGEGLIMNGKQGKRYIVNENCNTCGVCAKVCPTKNISVSDKVVFHESCEVCMACLHQCPKNALHMKSEKSTARWRHPEVSLAEIIKSNER